MVYGARNVPTNRVYGVGPVEQVVGIVNMALQRQISKVIGDELYFYANIKNGNQFQYFNRYGELIIREEKLRKIFKYEYLILSDNLSNEFLKDFLYFKSKSKLVKIAHLKINNNYKFKIIKQNDRNSYSATIYKVNN